MKSIFDGWTKQAKGSWTSADGGHCALGYIWDVGYAEGGYDRHRHQALTERIGQWIIANLNPPEGYRENRDGAPYPATNPTDAIIWANNEGKLDPDGFRMVDLLTQGYVPDAHPAAAVQPEVENATH